MSNGATSHCIWSFDDFVMDVDRGCVARDGRDIQLRPQSFAVLSYLVQHYGVLVTKQDLQDAVWGNKAVTDDSLTHCLVDIRRALGDDAHTMIRTVPRRGFIFEADVTEPNEREQIAAVSVNRWRLVAGIAIVLAIVGIWNSRQNPATSTTQDSAPIPNSIAVLPFVDLTEEQDQTYFAHGMSEEIINLLSGIDGLQVIARTSSFSFQDQNLNTAEIARQLSVSHVLEGSIRRTSEQIRVTAQLVDGASMLHLWSQTYDRQFDDAIRTQSDIAAAVAQVLEATLVGNKQPQEHSPAYDLFLQGRFIYNRRGPGDIARSLEYFQEAIDLDPNYAPAWGGIAAAYRMQIFAGEIEFESGLQKFRSAAETAVALDPDYAEGQLRLSNAYFMAGERERAGELFDRTWEKHPNNPLALSMAAGQAAWRGDIDTAIELNGRAVRLDPLNSVSINNQASFLAAAGRFDEAIAMNRKSLQLNPGSITETDALYAKLLILQGRYERALNIILQCPKSPGQDQGLALVYSALGRTSEAEAAMNRLRNSQDPRAQIMIAEVHAFRGDTDASFELLRYASDNLELDAEGLPVLSLASQIRFSPMLLPLHADERWAMLVPDSRW